MKKILIGLVLLMFAVPLAVVADEEITEPQSGTEIDLDSVRYNKNTGIGEIRMKIYNDNYQKGGNEMYYAMYYLKMDCTQALYKPMLIEGYNKRDELMLVDYEPRQMTPVTPGSNLEQAYNYACRINEIPQVSKPAKKKGRK